MKFLLIVADSLRYDEFAADLPGATVFAHAYATAGWTTASQAALLTGLYPHEAVQRGLDRADANEPLTVADRLVGIGYECRANWLLDVGHFRRGFEMAADDPPREWATAQLATGGDNRLVMFWIHHPHFPYQPSAEARARFGLDGEWRDVSQAIRAGAPPVRFADWASPRIVSEITRDVVSGDAGQEEPVRLEITRRELAYLRRAYAAAAWDVCRQLEVIWTVGLKHGWQIIFTSDHGEQFMEHGHLGHWDVHEENVHVPLVTHIEGLPPGARPYFASHIDIAPTIAAMAGGDTSQMSGVDLRGFLTRDTVFFESGTWGMRPWGFGLRNRVESLLYWPEQSRFERWDAKEDPEQVGWPKVFLLPQLPMSTITLLGQADAAMGTSGEQIAKGTLLRTLAQLGYVE